jgi:hypothetical protein
VRLSLETFCDVCICVCVDLVMLRFLISRNDIRCRKACSRGCVVSHVQAHRYFT